MPYTTHFEVSRHRGATGTLVNVACAPLQSVLSHRIAATSNCAEVDCKRCRRTYKFQTSEALAKLMQRIEPADRDTHLRRIAQTLRNAASIISVPTLSNSFKDQVQQNITKHLEWIESAAPDTGPEI